MKKRFLFISLYCLAVLSLPFFLKAQSSQLDPETAAGLDAARADRPSRDVPQDSIEYAIRRLPDTQRAHAGAPDAKEMQPAAPAHVDDEDGFTAPAAYSEYKYARIQDNRSIGFDGPQQNGIVGFDFESYWKTILGFNFTYTNESLSTSGGLPPPTIFHNSSNSYFFSTYAAKNFDDWINVGGAFTYGRTDTDWRADAGTVPIALGQKTTQDSYALSPFIGIAHTWGAFSFSSTTTYIWDYDHYGYDLPTVNGAVAPGTAPLPDNKTLNQTFLWLNNFQYAVDDKWTLSVQANWTRLLTIQSVPTPILPAIPALDHEWMSFGGKVEYAFNKDGNVFVQFEHDAFDSHFDDYRIRSGVSYNF